MIPDKIFLPCEYSEEDVLPLGVTSKQVFGKDTCYIRKDVLLEWLLYVKRLWSQTNSSQEALMTLQMIIDKLNSL